MGFISLMTTYKTAINVGRKIKSTSIMMGNIIEEYFKEIYSLESFTPVAVRCPIEFPKGINRQNNSHYYIKHFWSGQIMTSLRSCEHSHVGRHTNQTIFGRNHSFLCAVCSEAACLFWIGFSATGLFCARTTDEGQRSRQYRGSFVSSDEVTGYTCS